MNDKRTTNPELITYLLSLSEQKTTDLTVKMVRNYLNLPDTVGARTFNLLIPELKFTNCNYNGKPYLTIKKR